MVDVSGLCTGQGDPVFDHRVQALFAPLFASSPTPHQLTAWTMPTMPAVPSFI